MKPLRILCFSDIIPADFDGGSGRAAWEISRGLAARGNDVTMITRGLLPDNDTETIDGIKVLRYYKKPLKLYACVQKYLSKSKPDIIFTHSPLTSLARAFIDKRIPTIHMFYSPWHEEYEIRSGDLGRGRIANALGSISRKFLEHFVMRYAARIAVNSAFMSDKVRQYHNMNSILIPLGADIDKFKPALQLELPALKNKLRLPENRTILFTLRNLVSRMGLENLIASIRILSETNPEIYLTIGGSGYLKDKLQRQIEKLELQQFVRLEGRIDDNILAAYYQSADIFILPTRLLEGFGLITIESMACGTPVLATPVSANIELLEKFDKSMLFKDALPQSIAQGIASFLPRYTKQKGLIRKECRDFAANNYSWNACVDKLEKVINELI